MRRMMRPIILARLFGTILLLTMLFNWEASDKAMMTCQTHVKNGFINLKARLTAFASDPSKVLIDNDVKVDGRNETTLIIPNQFKMEEVWIMVIGDCHLTLDIVVYRNLLIGNAIPRTTDKRFEIYGNQYLAQIHLMDNHQVKLLINSLYLNQTQGMLDKICSMQLPF